MNNLLNTILFVDKSKNYTLSTLLLLNFIEKFKKMWIVHNFLNDLPTNKARSRKEKRRMK